MFPFAVLLASTIAVEPTPAPVTDATPLGFIFFGDAGNGRTGQFEVAAAVGRYCATQRCDFALLLGDNFYDDGVFSVNDPLWGSRFEAPYGSLGLVFHAIIGNHDMEGNVEAQVARSAVTPYWSMPSLYYTFASGPASFFALDTNDFNGSERRWLKSALDESPDTSWRIVYGHHPVESYGHHGGTQGLRDHLAPILNERAVDLYLSGHDHDMQVIAKDDHPLYVVSGAGARPRPTRMGKGSLFAVSTPGFGHLLIEGDRATLRMVDKNGKILYECALTRGMGAAGAVCQAGEQ